MEGHVLGIDLGTTNTVVAVADDRRVRVLSSDGSRRLIPSIVSFPPDGPVLVGEAARARRLEDVDNTVYSVKRLIGRPYDSPEVRRTRQRFAFKLIERQGGGVGVDVRGEVYTLTEISAFVLREVRRVAEGVLEHTCDRAVVTVPANFNELQRSATKAAGQVAGIDVLRIINEPTAAALAYGYGQDRRERVVVYDFGGGTFDVTVLELEGDVYEVVSTAGDTFLGGDDIDLALAESLADAFLERHRVDPREDFLAFEKLRDAAERAKVALSQEEVVDVRVEEVLRDGKRPLSLAHRLTRGELEALAEPLIQRSLEVCDRAMDDAGAAPTLVDNVILVGGSTRMPLMRRLVTEHFGREPHTRIDPDLVVAQGAAIHAHAVGGGRALVSVPPGAPVPDAAAAPDEDGEVLDPEALETMDLDELLSSGDDEADVLPILEPDVLEADEHEHEHAHAHAHAHEQGGGSSRKQREDDTQIDLMLQDAMSLPSARPPRGDATQVDLKLPHAAPAPLLLDVTPHSLGIETVGGFCSQLIPRNAPIPAEQTRIFATAQDDQQEVALRVCQGESRTFEENQLLGEVALTGLRRAARGAVRVDVSFKLDASGSLQVEATDSDTGQVQRIHVQLLGGADEDEIASMRARQEGMVGT
jgi:molecular chaperone DnaK (HSP70)